MITAEAVEKANINTMLQRNVKTMVLGVEGAENEFLSEQNLYDATSGFPLKIKKFPNQRFRQYCRLLYVSGAFGRYIAFGVSEKVRLEQKIVPKNMVGRGEDAAENKKNFFISIAFFCWFSFRFC